MLKKLMWLVPAAALAAPLAQAQDPRGEVSASAGWTFSDGVSGDPVRAGDGNVYDRLDPKDAFSWGLRLGYLVNHEVEIGFLFNQQRSTLEAQGTATREIGSMAIGNYHGYFAYNFGDVDASARPYLLGGLGFTHYAGIDFTDAQGSSYTIGGESRFSTTWGVGVKVMPAQNIGLRLEGRWTPTYIKSDAAGWWCDPFWGCYLVGNAQYSNQFELSGGITLRF